MSSDEEPDYMSDDFLAKCIPTDVRPGLKMTHAHKREHELQKKKDELKEKSEPKKSKKELEDEKRNEGLQKSIDSSNIGFAMLQKMGYKTGESLGKSKSGIVEPISFSVKTNRRGLGRDEVLKEIESSKNAFRQKRLEERKRMREAAAPSTAEYRAQKSKQRRAKQVQSDLYQSQKSCRQLDLAKNFNEPPEEWFWPEEDLSGLAFDDDDDRVQHQEKQKSSRQESESEEESEDSDHGEGYIEEVEEDPTSGQAPKVEEVNEEFEPEEKLSILTKYLRTEHLFCMWCGITFNDVRDLEVNCPGNTREDHDD